MALDTRNNGFSLIELLVVCAIILTITGLVISNYSSFTDTQKVRQAGRTLKNDLRFIQTRAASGLKPAGCTTLRGYRVTFGANSYSYQVVCSNGLFAQSQPVTLPNGVTITQSPGNFDFQVLTGASSRADFPVQLSIRNRRYSLSVKQNGDLEDLGFGPTPTP